MGGFCLSQRQLDGLPSGDLDVVIESTLGPGSLTYGEALVRGLTEDEVLIVAHACHPSLCDDNLSGISIATLLARDLSAGPPLRHSVRFLFAPGTIGAIAWLARNTESLEKITAGLTLTCLGDAHPFTFKRTLTGDTLTDRAAAHALHLGLATPGGRLTSRTGGRASVTLNSPGFRLPGRIAHARSTGNSPNTTRPRTISTS